MDGDEVQEWPQIHREYVGLRDIVQVLMPYHLAKDFEDFLAQRGGLSLSGPLRFSEDDLPTFIIEIA